VRQRRVWEITRRERGLIEGAQERERIEARLFQPPAEIDRHEWGAMAAAGHAATRTMRN
jgi:hypothetical protein